ncbi:putative protein kinase RLK-Pelle-CrRLK1L-1 family [Helianthus debilis subsp. tardiflorus]
MASSSVQSPHTFRPIEFSEILRETNGFDEASLVGTGGFGDVYKGNITYGASTKEVAFKRMKQETTQGVAGFWSEINTLSELHHSNIVSLIGYCDHGSDKILVYEYVPNNSLKDHLHTLNTPLSWLQRLNICINVGQGLLYMHEYMKDDKAIIHGDLKSSNVLLKNDLVAKLSDFGLSRACSKDPERSYVVTDVKGTFGYIDPLFFDTGKLRRKSDVYSFGVLLLEVMCRKRVLDDNLYGAGESLVTWAKVNIKQRNFKSITDLNIWDEISSSCLKKFISIVESCLQKELDSRPSMAEVVANLQDVKASQLKRDNHPSGKWFGCI